LQLQEQLKQDLEFQAVHGNWHSCLIMLIQIGCLQTQDRRPKNEDRKTDPNFVMPDKARTGKKTKPKRSSVQTDAKITGSSFCRKDPLNLQNEDPR